METIELSTVKPRISSILALGMEGSGKTAFLATFPKPVLVYSFDGGYRTLAGVDGIRAKVFLDQTAKAPVAAKEFEAEIGNLLARKEPMYRWPDGREEPFKTVCLDTLTHWSNEEAARIQFTNATVEKKMNWDEYDLLGKRGRELIRKMQRLVEEQGLIVAATCHVMTDKDEDTGQIWFFPDMLGSIRKELGSHFDAVVYLKSEIKQDGTKSFKLHTIGERRERARLRLPRALDGVIKAVDEPDFSAILARMDAAKGTTVAQGKA